MLHEEGKDNFVKVIDGLPHKHNGNTFAVEVIRAGEDYPKEDPFIVVSFLPTSEKVAMALNFYGGKRDNALYKNHLYGEVEMCVIRAFSADGDDYDGRTLADAWLWEIERYIKNNWNTLINEGSIDRGSFKPYREIYSDQVEHQYGYEMMFKIITTNKWTDEPEDPNDIVDLTDVEEVKVEEFGDDKKYKITVKI